MNLKNARKLLEQLKALPDSKFDMAIEISRCGTVGCVAGWASILNGGPKNLPEYVPGRGFQEEPMDWADKWLDLTEEEHWRLFYAHAILDGRSLSEVSRAEMIDELQLMIQEGEQSCQQ